VAEVSALLQELRDTMASPVSSAVRPVEVNGLVRGAVEIARAKWQEGSLQRGPVVDLRFEPAPEPLLVETSIGLVGPLVNVLGHAAETISEGGQIRVRTRRDNGYVVISVEDGGRGPSGHLEAQPFAPVGSPAGPPYLRLGLSMFDSFAARHGGEARLSTSESGGMALTLRLPQAGVVPTPENSDV